MEYEAVNIYEVDGKRFTFDSLVNEVQKVAREAHWVAWKKASETNGEGLSEKEIKAYLVLSNIFTMAESHLNGLPTFIQLGR